MSKLIERTPLIVRGDLRSQTGYARACRALVKLLNRRFQRFDLFGVDLHPDPGDEIADFGFPIISDVDAVKLVENSRQNSIVLHYVGVDDFVAFPGAHNIGAFYWETSAVPYARHWPVLLDSMDTVWAPTNFLAEFARRCGFRRHIATVPWPHEFPRQQRPPNPRLLAEIPVSRVFSGQHRETGLSIASTDLKALRREARTMFFAVQSLAPRKGIPILLREWRSYIQGSQAPDLLVLRLSFRHARGIDSDWRLHFLRLLEEAGLTVGDPRIAIIESRLDDTHLGAAYSAADCYVSASYGEGFGGPIAEALVAERPVIAPRHSGIADLIAPDYPLAVQSDELCVGLRGSLDVYPQSSTWFVPRPGEIADRFRQFAAMSPGARQQLTMRARLHAEQFCSVPAVLQTLERELARLSVGSTDGAGLANQRQWSAIDAAPISDFRS